MSHPTLVISPALYCGAVEEEETKALGVEAVPNAKEMPKKCKKPKNNNLCVGLMHLCSSFLPATSARTCRCIRRSPSGMNTSPYPPAPTR